MIGTVINGQYQILELIGEGGMGVVYKARDILLKRNFALKFIKAQFGNDPALIESFLDELRILAGFNHPNITFLQTAFMWENRPVMVMELLEGEAFDKIVEQFGPRPANICVPLVIQAMTGVKELHRKGIIHRDLKPANLMVTSDGVVKVMDFGISKAEDAPGITSSNITKGTPLYMAPEQILGQQVDSRVDIYAMGVTLYQLLAGQVPFSGNTLYSIHKAHIEQVPQPPTVHYPHIPKAVVDVVMCALQKAPKDRFQNAEEFVNALNEAIAVKPETKKTAPVPSVTRHSLEERDTKTDEPTVVADPTTKRKTMLVISGVGLIAVALIAIIVTFLSSSSVERQRPTVSKISEPPPLPPKLPLPVFFPAASKSDSAQTVTITEITPGATIFYTLDGSRPTNTSTKYISSLKITENSTIRAIATAAGYSQSEEASATYTLARSQPTSSARWTGSFTRCEDNRVTPADLTFSEQASGRVTGVLVLQVSKQVRDDCSIDGNIFVTPTDHKKHLKFKVGSCSGGAPAYLKNQRSTSLDFEGSQLSGQIDSADACQAVQFNRR